MDWAPPFLGSCTAASRRELLGAAKAERGAFQGKERGAFMATRRLD
jgi:hypothetical protein